MNARLAAVLALAGALTGQSWVDAKLTTSGGPLVFDSHRSRVVTFGEGTNFTSVTREWDGAHWTERVPATSPSPRRYHAMAFDRTRGRTVLFGGETGAGYLGDTWEWNGIGWIQLNPAASPPSRSNHVMTYDAARSRVVLHAGINRTGSVTLFNDTWEWDGTTWSQKPTSVAPPPRMDAAMEWDGARGRVLLFGGFVSGGWSADTWEWDGTSWTERFPGLSPYPSYGHSMAYDSARARVVLFGGNRGTFPAETWEWDGILWRMVTPATRPPAHANPGLTYDAVRGRTVMFGVSDKGILGTWEYDGVDWSVRAAGERPPYRSGYSALAFDAGRGVVTGFFGELGAPNTSSTWEWQGTTWTQRTPTTNPPPRSSTAVAYDASRGRIVLFGGGSWLSDTWEWDGNDWSLQTPAAAPSARAGHAMAYDPLRARVVLFGGQYFSATPIYYSDTWEWDGSTWSKRNPTTSPPARTGHAMAYDVARGRIVMFGGGATSALADTWEWDGTNWSQRAPATSPTARSAHSLAYDAARSVTVLFGGGGSLADTWEWNGTTWASIATATSPAPGAGSMAYDAARGTMVLFNGKTWLYGSLVAATTSPFGTGCAGSNGPPLLSSSLPQFGSKAFALDLVSARTASPCAFGLSAATQTLGLGGGCSLYLSGATVLVPGTTNASGFASAGLPIPFDPALQGGLVYAQAFVADPNGAFAGIALSAALQLRLGR